MAGIAYPSWAYNATTLQSLIVASAAAFAALGTGWSFTPFPPPPPSGVPVDPGFPNTDTRLQQILIESRVQTMLLSIGLNVTDDPQTQLRPDVLANDASLAS